MTQEALKKMQWHVLTQAQYDALETKNPNDVYAIVDDKGDYTETKLNKMIFNVMSADTYKALETKDPNQIYYVTGENKIIEHKSWTDGSQNSVTPAGFQDNGYRNISRSNFGYNPDCTYEDNSVNYYSSDLDQTLTVHCLNNNKDYPISTVWGDIGYIRYYKLLQNTSNAAMFIGLQMQITRNTLGEIYTYDGETLTYTPQTNINYPIPYIVVTQITDNSAESVTFDNNAIYGVYQSQTVTSFNNLYYYIAPGNALWVGISANHYFTEENSAGVTPTIAIQLTTCEILDHTDASAINAKADYEAITTELTARGNTITSLNTQGQNLVTAYNNLADKYNTAGIIVTED